MIFEIIIFFALFVGVDQVDFNLYPDKELQKQWLRYYLNEYIGEENVQDHIINKLYVQANQFALAAHLFWGIWCLIQVEYSNIDFDFVKYVTEVSLLSKIFYFFRFLGTHLRNWVNILIEKRNFYYWSYQGDREILIKRHSTLLCTFLL